MTDTNWDTRFSNELQCFVKVNEISLNNIKNLFRLYIGISMDDMLSKKNFTPLIQIDNFYFRMLNDDLVIDDTVIYQKIDRIILSMVIDDFKTFFDDKEILNELEKIIINKPTVYDISKFFMSSNVKEYIFKKHTTINKYTGYYEYFNNTHFT